MSQKNFSFHLSLPCKDVAATKKFYRKELGFPIGRYSFSWFDVNIFQNQITFTEDAGFVISSKKYKFEEEVLPTFHFGVIVDNETWNKLHDKYKEKPYFATGSRSFLTGKKGAHQSFFIQDPNEYYIEFKTFLIEGEVFEEN